MCHAAVTAWRDLGAEFFQLLALTRARMTRERRPATDEEIAALRELYIRGRVASSYPGTPSWDELEAELRAKPDPLTIMRLDPAQREAYDEARRLLDEVEGPIEGDTNAAAPLNLTRPPPSLPPDVNLFAFSSIQKGARKFADGASINRVARETVFDLHDAPRLNSMLGRGFFRLHEGKLLPPDWRVGRAGKKYALRFLDEAAWKWVDPAGTGRTPG